MFISIIQDQLKNLRFLLSFYAIYIIKMLNVRIIESCLFFLQFIKNMQLSLLINRINYTFY